MGGYRWRRCNRIYIEIHTQMYMFCQKAEGSVTEPPMCWGNLSQDFPGPSHETVPLPVIYSSLENASSSCLALG